jgi:endonuclease III
MTTGMWFFNRITQIYGLLQKSYNTDGRFSDQNAMNGVNQWAEVQLGDHYIPDYYYLLNVCYGPWVEERQKSVWLRAYKSFKQKYNGDLTLVPDEENLTLPFRWQVKHIRRLATFLKGKGLSFHQFLDSLKGRTGLQVRDEFRNILHAVSTKVISTFIRDYLNLEVFPIDSRVDRILSYLGLPRDEDMMVSLCQGNVVNPKELNRMLYDYYGKKCASSESKTACHHCILLEHCYYGWLFRS